ncbi:hypothetical protein EBZ80_15610, partial [bacterium]|nr:hypothetical protein [bacterium]
SWMTPFNTGEEATGKRRWILHRADSNNLSFNGSYADLESSIGWTRDVTTIDGFTREGNSVVLYRNVNQTAAGTLNWSGSLVPYTDTSIRIFGSTVGNHFNGFIGEVVYYNRKLTGSEIAQVQSYLNTKWNIVAVPALADITSTRTFVAGAAATPLTFTNTGSAVTSCSVSPALPAGLSVTVIGGTCVITGTPATTTATTIYSITSAAVSGLTDTATVSITTTGGLVADGLALLLDASNTSSYPGSGTTWYDLTGNQKHATFQNGPVFSSAGASSISFDGIDDYAEGPIAVTGNTNATMTGWVYVYLNTAGTFFKNSAGGGGFSVGIGQGSFDTVGSNVISLFPHVRWMGTSTAWNPGWQQVTMTLDATGNARVFKNSALISTHPAGANLAYGSYYLAANIGDNNRNAKIKIGAFAMYNRALSESEIASNYASQRSRFEPFNQPNMADATTQTYTAGSAITPLVFTNTGVPSISCTVSPPLPAGLTIAVSGGTCAITGTPATTTPATTYTVTGTSDIGGTDTATVTISTSGGLVADGLVLLLDAGNASSYSGSGTTWYDLSGGGRNATIYGATFNSAVGGNLTFNGTSSYAEAPAITSISDNNSRTVIVRYKTGSTNNVPLFDAGSVGTDRLANQIFGAAVNGVSGGPPTNPGGICLVFFGRDLYFPVGATKVLNDQWNHVAYAYDGTTGSVRIFLNGVPPETAYRWSGVNTTLTSQPFALATTISTTNNPVWIGRSRGRLWSLGSDYLSGSIATLEIYNRALSNGEMLQNFEANKRRFISRPELADTKTQKFISGTPVTPVTFANTGSAAVSCSVTPSLPQGLYISVVSDTCQIDGTPVGTQNATVYTVRATSQSGESDIATTSIQVNSDTDSGILVHLDAANASSYPGSGSTWTDLSGNGNHATLQSGAAYSTADGGSIAFGSGGAQAEIPANPLFEHAGDFAIELWMKLNTLNNGDAMVPWSTGGSGSTDQVWIGTGGYGVPSGAFYGVGCSPCPNFMLITTTGWQHVVVSRTGSVSTFFVNGTQVGSHTYSGTIGRNGVMRLGRRVDNYHPLDGNIAALRVYRKTGLTAAEVARNYQFDRQKFNLPTDLMVDLDPGIYQGSGTNWQDRSGNGRDHTLFNGPVYLAENGGSFSFDGINDYAESAAFTPNITAKTMMAWVKLSSVTQGGGGLVGIMGSGGEPFDSIVYNETNQGWGFGSSNWSRTAWSGVKETSTSEWVHVAATYANNNYNLYRNGVKILTTTSYAALNFNFESKVIVGKRHNSLTGPLGASIGQVKVYRRALSATEILAEFDSAKSRYISTVAGNGMMASGQP